LATKNLNGADQRTLQDAIESLRAEVTRLNDRLAAVELALQPAPAKAPAPPPPAPPAESDETLIYLITAAVAAYLGVKPHIRQIRLVSGASWAQQGRVTIQASHALSVRHE
jgi:methylmalonyl-CoA carboxyltransferase large subunit